MMRVVDTIPRNAQDFSIVLLRDEHGRSMLDDTPLRYEPMLRAMRYMKEQNRQYQHVKIDEENLQAVCLASEPFFVESDTEGDSAVPGTTAHPLESSDAGASTEEPAIRPHGLSEREGAGSVMNADDDTGNVFLVNSADNKPLRQIAIEAFTGVNYPLASEPGYDATHGRGEEKRAFSTAYSSEGLYELGFPHLFFKGTGGPGHARPRPVTESELVCHLLRLHHRRFSRDAQFSFFAHSIIQRRTVNGVTATLSESRKLTSLVEALVNTLGLPDATRLEKEAALDRCIDSMTPQMSTVKGSRGYWEMKTRDLQSMVHSPLMSSPTLFMTLSAADSLWLDFLEVVFPTKTMQEIQYLSKSACSEALVAHPDLAVEHFNKRWTALWDEIIMGDGAPLGCVSDFFWRIEFQERGSPHVHMLLWVDDSPNLSELREGVIPEEMRHFVDKIVCAQVRPDMNELDFSEVMHPCTMRSPVYDMFSDVTQSHVAALSQCVQTHRCNKYCKPNGRHTKCRFGFPRPLVQETHVERVFRNGKTKLVVSPARNHSRVNAYNPSILSCWAANMDIQILLDAFGAAVYTASYMTKHEKHSQAPRVLYQLSKSAKDSSVKHMVRRVINSVLNTRQVSVQEALWIRTGKKLCHGSRTIVTLPSLFFQLGEARVHDDDRKVFMRTDCAVSHENGLLTFYINRPNSLQNLSLFEFTSHYSQSHTVSSDLKLKISSQRDGYAVRRPKPAIVQVRAYITRTDKVAFSKAMLFLHAPWTSLESIIAPGMDPEVALESLVGNPDCAHLREIISHYKEIESRESLMRTMRNSDALDKERENTKLDMDCSVSDESTDLNHLDGPPSNEADDNLLASDELDCGLSMDRINLPSLEQAPMPGLKILQSRHARTDHAIRAVRLTKAIIESRGRAPAEDVRVGDGLDPPGIDPKLVLSTRVDSLNSEQKHVYNSVVSDLSNGVRSKRVVLIGPGGTGKSYLIDTLSMLLDVRSTNTTARPSPDAVKRRHGALVKTACTGVAAANIGGLTLHNALEINQKEIVSEVTDASLPRLQRDWEKVQVLVIDEISFLSPINLHAISERLGNIFPHRRDSPFAGLYVIMAGDPFQLAPVGGKTLWKRDHERTPTVQELVGRDYYLDCDSYFELGNGQRNHGLFF